MFTMGEITSDTRRCSMARQAPLGWDTEKHHWEDWGIEDGYTTYNIF
jgi:hypothetical protein